MTTMRVSINQDAQLQLASLVAPDAFSNLMSSNLGCDAKAAAVVHVSGPVHLLAGR